jgi:UTP--glucose-1-phosphate uridylyltransferase
VALKAGKVAILVLNGGMATRFGGGAKGVVPVVPGHGRVSFLAIKLAEVRQRAQSLGTGIPVVLMHSFATQGASQGHLAEIDWAGLPERDRDWFAQSIMPRVLPDGTPLQELPEAADLPDTTLYSAPGHGDTLGRFRQSGVLSRLRARGVEHVLVSNVDNVGASLDPVVLGAHLEGGAGVSVEVVRRADGDAGGCVARLPDGVDAIIEGFRLPEGVDVADYPHFNTNTLWLSADAVDRDIELTWFAVRKAIDWPGRKQLEVVQFERLIGQVTEFVPSAYLEVDRERRFLPIKTRGDLSAAEPELRKFAAQTGLL